MLEIISGIMFGLGLAMFEWGWHNRKTITKEEQRQCKKMKVGFGNYKTNYDYDEDDKNPIFEDVMFYTGLSDEELDEILPDYNMDLEDFE